MRRSVRTACSSARRGVPVPASVSRVSSRSADWPPEVPVEEGVRPTVRLITDPAPAGVTGRGFDRFSETAAHEQAYAPRAGERLAALARGLLA
ncbi:hypothetical protein [Streptomyces sp. NPDC088726]